MTRQLEIVNLSNWDGEDYEVVYLSHTGKPCGVIIKPGESTGVVQAHEAGGILYKPVQRCDEEGKVINKPFEDENGKQTFPTMKLDIE